MVFQTSPLWVCIACFETVMLGVFMCYCCGWVLRTVVMLSVFMCYCCGCVLCVCVTAVGVCCLLL